MAQSYSIEILDRSREFVTPVNILVPIDTSNNTMHITFRLSNWGKCRFRVATKDPLFETVGDVLEPWKYHVRVKREGTTIWQGVIVKNPIRNRKYVEVVAYSYLFILSKNLIRHDSSATPGDGRDNYRTFSSGTMSAAVTALINEAKADVGTNNTISSITVGTIDNPNFPANYTKVDNTPLTGAWTFSSDMTLQYDYRDTLYLIASMASYPACDYELTNSLVFNFRTFLGTRQPKLCFKYGPNGNVLDYNIPRDGERMANSLMGVAADFGNQILHVEKADEASVNTYGKIQDVAAFIDVKNTNALRSRLTEELRLISTPDSEIQLTLNNKAYPFGQYGIGDIVTVDIQDGVISFKEQRRIVGVDIRVDNAGGDSVTLFTNRPKEGI